MSGPAVLEISVSEFKAKCLGIFKDLEAHRLEKVVVTRRGRPVAFLHRTSVEPRRPLYGALAERTHVSPGFDLTEPMIEDIPEAERGQFYEE